MANRVPSQVAVGLVSLTNEAASGVPDAELLRRFAEARDEAAFELLVWRHGAMVLGACRRVLGRSADAEDAFQAVFLVLARKAGSVRRGEALGGWLHRVALRVGVRSRSDASRRARRESHPLPESAAAPEVRPADDTAAVLDEEIGRLPDKLRVAFVLCHLDGHTHEEAATELGCPRGTVLSRVARARERLQARLTKRGFAVPLIAAIVVTPQPVVSAALLATTVKAGVAFAVGGLKATATDRATSLAREALRATATRPLKYVVVFLAALALGVGAVLATQTRRETEVPPEPRPEPVAATPDPVPAPASAPARDFKLEATRHVSTIHFSPDSRWLLSTGNDDKGGAFSGGKTLVWDTATGKPVHTPEALSEGKVAFSPDGKLFAIAGGVLVRVETWKPYAYLPHRAAYRASFSPDGRFVVTYGAGPEGPAVGLPKSEHGVKVWDAATGKEVFEQVTREELWSVAFTPDGKLMATLGDSAKVWDVATGKLIFEQVTDGQPRSASFSPDGRTLAVRARATVYLFDAKTGEKRAEIPSPKRDATDRPEVTFSPDGMKLFIHMANVMELWDVATGKRLHKLVPNGRGRHTILDPQFSPDGTRVVASGYSWPVDADFTRQEVKTTWTMWVWDAATGKELVSFPTVSRDGLTFSVDGAVVAVTGTGLPADKRTRVTVLYRLKDGEELARLPGADNVVFAPDGKNVAVLNRGDRVVTQQVNGFTDAPSDEPNEVFIRDLADLIKPKQ